MKTVIVGGVVVGGSHIGLEPTEAFKAPMLFIRGAEAEEAWRVIDPVMHVCATGDAPMQEYVAGHAPPGPAA